MLIVPIVGRIAHIETSGNTVTVLLAPVQITDVIERGKFLVSEDLNLSDAIVYSAHDLRMSTQHNAS